MKLSQIYVGLLLGSLSVVLDPTPAAADASAAPPATPRRPVTEALHGVTLRDDYRWLEDFADPAVRAWNDAQNRYTRATLDRSPAGQALRAQVQELFSDRAPRYAEIKHHRGVLFAMKIQPPREQPFLVTLRSPDDLASEVVLVDPGQLATEPRGTTAIDFYVPSPDGARVAVSLSQGGTEEGTVHVFDVATRKQLPDVIPRVNGGTAGGDLAWTKDGTGFYYTRYPREGERPREDLNFYQQVYFHQLGAPTSSDRLELGKELPRIAETTFVTAEDGRHLLAQVANGDGGDYAFYLRGQGGGWQQVARFEDQVVAAAFGPPAGGALLLLSRKGAARGQVLSVPLSTPTLAQAKTLVPESPAVLQRLLVTRSRLYTLELSGGMSQIRSFDLSGPARALPAVPVRPVSAVRQLVRLSGDDLLFDSQSYTEPQSWLHYSPGARTAVRRTALSVPPRVDFRDVELVRLLVASRDGAKIPLNIMLRRGTKLDGQNPLVLTGYGGFGYSLMPSFSPTRRVWLDQGGIYAVANLRGGGEFGEEWHKAGMLTRKQNVFDDFLACAQHLIAAGYTRPERLAIEGGSNGGLLVGAALTQRPELFRAAVAYVGLYDMLRFERYPNGAFNVTEYGSIADRAQFQALYAYSPYHRVRDGAAYPAVLLLSGENDPRVNPADSRKLAARLQAATSSGRPVLLRTRSGAGHSPHKLSDRIEQTADVFTFLLQQLGVSYRGTSPTR